MSATPVDHAAARRLAAVEARLSTLLVFLERQAATGATHVPLAAVRDIARGLAVAPVARRTGRT